MADSNNANAAAWRLVDAVATMAYVSILTEAGEGEEEEGLMPRAISKFEPIMTYLRRGK